MKNQVKTIDLRREQASSHSEHEFDWLGGAVGVISMTCLVFGIIAFSHGDWIFLLILIAGMVVCGLFISCLQAFRSDAKGDSRDLVDNPANRANRMEYGEARYQYLSSQESFYLRAGAQAGSGIGSLLALVSGTSIPFHLARAGASALRKKAQQHEAVS